MTQSARILVFLLAIFLVSPTFVHADTKDIRHGLIFASDEDNTMHDFGTAYARLDKGTTTVYVYIVSLRQTMVMQLLQRSPLEDGEESWVMRDRKGIYWGFYVKR